MKICLYPGPPKSARVKKLKIEKIEIKNKNLYIIAHSRTGPPTPVRVKKSKIEKKTDIKHANLLLSRLTQGRNSYHTIQI